MNSKLLIIDDDKSFLKMLKKSLEIYDYSVDYTDNIDSVKKCEIIITEKRIIKRFLFLIPVDIIDKNIKSNTNPPINPRITNVSKN